MKLKNPLRLSIHSCSLLNLAMLFGATVPLWAETVVVESRSGGKNFTAYSEGTGNWANSTAKSSAADVTPGIGSRFATTDASLFRVTPILQAGANYSVEVTHGTSSNIPTDLQVGISQTNCTGLASSTTAFNQVPDNVWRSVGTITVAAGVTNPTIVFTKTAGSTGTGQRIYADGVRFINLADPCLASLPQLITVNGPLAAGQTFVDVPAVTNIATAVTVYADGVQIGQKTSGITNGVNRVTVSALVKGRVITVTQSNGSGVESCRPTTGPLVGGGSNPRIRVSLNIKQGASATALTGPIGSDGGTATGPLKFLGATNTAGGGFGNAPVGGRVIIPSTNWQTVSFLRGADPANPVDPTFAWANSDGTSQIKYDFGILDAIAFGIDDLTDTGPFVVYLDNVMNGDVVIQDFESASPGANTVLFNQPSFSGSTAPFLLSQAPGSTTPNISKVSNDTADSSGNCLQVSWQFKDTGAGDWLRLVGQGSGTPDPEVDLRLPISFRILLLPVGQGIPQTAPVIATQPQGQEVFQSGRASLFVAAHGSPQPLSYQWFFNGNPISNATNRSITLTNIQPSSAGNYSVDVANALGTNHSSTAAVSVVPTTISTVMTPLWSLAPGSRPYLTNDGTQRGIAYNPISGNLLVVSGASGSNGIYVLDGNTGAFIRTLNTDPGVITGGALALNQIGVADDGAVFAGNLSTNLAAPLFKLYSWPDDSGLDAPHLAWAGDPSIGGSGGPARWGDTMAVRGAADFQIILVSSRSGTEVSMIQPTFGSSSAPTVVDVTGAEPGDFGLGLAFGEGNSEGDTIWSKNINGQIRHTALDFFGPSGTVLESFASYPNMGPIGVNPTTKLLGGISTETPDNLRLLDLSNPAAGLFNLDTEFFPTDNPNPNHTGAVAFAPNRVYASDASNGIIALNLSLACAPSQLTLVHSGSDAILSWNRGDYRLQGAGTLGNSAVWGDIPGASPVTNSLLSGIKYFRLVCP